MLHRAEIRSGAGSDSLRPPWAARSRYRSGVVGNGRARHPPVECSPWIAASRATIAYLESLPPAQFEGAEDRTITWQTRSSTKSMQGTAYLFNHMLPNVFFHVTTAYDILRQSGLPIGKADYLAA